MIVAMQEGADEALIQQVIENLVKMGFEVHRSTGARMTVLGAVGSGIDFDIRIIELLPGVQEVHRISSPYKLAGRSFRPEGTIVQLRNGIGVGANEIVVMAGPCSVETREQTFFDRGGSGEVGSESLAGRGVQAEKLSVFISGAWRRCVEVAARSWREIRVVGDQRGDGDFANSADAALRRYSASRRAQHAELQSAARAGKSSKARAAEAWNCGDSGRTAAFG